MQGTGWRRAAGVLIYTGKSIQTITFPRGNPLEFCNFCLWDVFKRWAANLFCAILSPCSFYHCCLTLTPVGRAAGVVGRSSHTNTSSSHLKKKKKDKMSSHFKCNHSKFEQYPLQIMKQLVRWKKPSDNLTYMKHALKRNPFLLTKAVPQSRRWQEPCTYQRSTALTQKHCPYSEQPRCHPGLQKKYSSAQNSLWPKLAHTAPSAWLSLQS